MGRMALIATTSAWLAASIWLIRPPLALHGQQGPAAAATTLDFDTFKSRVQPIFLAKRKGHARCYVCHSQGTAFRLRPLPPGRTSWTEDETRQNFDASVRFTVPGQPLASRLLTMPLAAEAGGVAFHPGGKHWASRDDPEWQTLAAWVRGDK